MSGSDSDDIIEIIERPQKKARTEDVAGNLVNTLQTIVNRCFELSEEYSVATREIAKECKNWDADKEPLEDWGYNRRKLIDSREACNIRKQLRLGNKYSTRLSEIENHVKDFVDVVYSNFKRDHPERVSEIGYHVEYELFNIRAFIKTMKDVFENENKEYYEDIILHSQSLRTKLYFRDVLTNYIKKSIDKPSANSSMSLLCKYASELANTENDRKLMLRICYDLLLTAMDRHLLDNDRERVENLPENIRTLLLDLFLNVRAVVIGSAVLSSSAMELFLSTPNNRSLTWQFALEHPGVRDKAEEKCREMASWIADEAKLFPLVRDSPSNEAAFVDFREMLTNDDFFGSRLDPLRTDISFPLGKIDLFAANTHGSCRYDGSHNLRGSEIPEGLTVYYVTNVSHDLDSESSKFSETDNFIKSVKRSLRYGLDEERTNKNDLITEKELVTNLVDTVRRHREYLQKGYNIGKKLFSTRKEGKLNATRVPFYKGNFVVKRYQNGDFFPYRRWSSDKAYYYNHKYQYVVYSSSIAVKPEEGWKKNYDSDRLFARAKTLGTKAIIVIDFSCRSVHKMTDQEREQETAQPQLRSRNVHKMYHSGRLIAFAGGRRRKREERSQTRTKKIGSRRSHRGRKL